MVWSRDDSMSRGSVAEGLVRVVVVMVVVAEGLVWVSDEVVVAGTAGADEMERVLGTMGWSRDGSVSKGAVVGGSVSVRVGSVMEVVIGGTAVVGVVATTVVGV